MGPDMTDEDSGDPLQWSRTDELCAQCEERLAYTEEVFLLQIVRPEVAEGTIRLVPVLAEDGDFLYEPYFLHFSCWEDVLGELKDESKDCPPVPDDMSVLECSCCKSGIREWEYCAALNLGEFHISARSPSGEGCGPDFVEMSTPDVLCLYCVSIINENWLEFWATGIAQDQECDDCLHARCWRTFSCECTCHSETEHVED